MNLNCPAGRSPSVLNAQAGGRCVPDSRHAYSRRMPQRPRAGHVRNVTPDTALVASLKGLIPSDIAVAGAGSGEMYFVTDRSRGWGKVTLVQLVMGRRFASVVIDNGILELAANRVDFIRGQCEAYVEHLRAEAEAGIT